MHHVHMHILSSVFDAQGHNVHGHGKIEFRRVVHILFLFFPFFLLVTSGCLCTDEDKERITGCACDEGVAIRKL